jgi:hypothetical protein
MAGKSWAWGGGREWPHTQGRDSTAAPAVWTAESAIGKVVLTWRGGGQRVRSFVLLRAWRLHQSIRAAPQRVALAAHEGYKHGSEQSCPGVQLVRNPAKHCPRFADCLGPLSWGRGRIRMAMSRAAVGLACSPVSDSSTAVPS